MLTIARALAIIWAEAKRPRVLEGATEYQAFSETSESSELCQTKRQEVNNCTPEARIYQRKISSDVRERLLRRVEHDGIVASRANGIACRGRPTANAAKKISQETRSGEGERGGVIRPQKAVGCHRGWVARKAVEQRC